ncbi:ParB/RepB/Spo0J family partition protein [Flavobacteriales bacterium]|nr:ParB/RepB/Spo0J family partition protein [Flavobacteriales bacterium]
MAKRKSGLGKGLGALLENSETDITSSSPSLKAPSAGSVSKISVNDIEANPFQPRSEFKKEALVDLANSIKEHGIIQPITVRKLGYGKYQLISGERRFRASQIVGLTEVPAYIRIANDQAMLEMAIVENIQRQDLNPVEVAISFKRLIEECDLTQEELGEKVSKNRSTVTNYLRLLKLPDVIQLALSSKIISMGHARALLGIENEGKLIKSYRKVIDEALSVRKTEELVKGINEPSAKVASKSPRYSLSYEEQKMRDELSQQVNSKVAIAKTNKGNGKITIPFKDHSHLRKILDLLNE